MLFIILKQIPFQATPLLTLLIILQKEATIYKIASI